MERENAFDPDSVGDFTYREGASQAAALDANNNAFKRLKALPIPFDDADLDPHRISRTKCWEILFHLHFVDMG
jgi:hypothetical protein